MKISVNFINQNVVLDVEPSTTVDDLKKIIYEKLRVLTSMQCVVYGAREMSKDSSQLSDYNITSNALITLSLKKHITSSFDRKIQQIPTAKPIIEKTESYDQQGDKKESLTPGKLKSATRVHFDDLRTLTESYVEMKEDVRGSPDVYQTDVRGFISEYDIVNTHEAMKMPTIGTPQKCSVDEFEASPVFQKDIVVNEAYLLQIPYDTLTVQRDGHRVDSTREMKEALGAELYSEYAACSFYSALCSYESFKVSLKYALKAHDIGQAKVIAGKLTDLGYTPADITRTASDMRQRIHVLCACLKERYDRLAEQSDVPGCCICVDALNIMTKLLADNQADDAKEFSFCSIYPVLCKHELLTASIKEALKARQIERARVLQNHLLALKYQPLKDQAGLAAADIRQRLSDIEERLKERYSSSAERADIDDSIYCTELLSKVQNMLIEGEKAMAQVIFESEKDLVHVSAAGFFNCSSVEDDLSTATSHSPLKSGDSIDSTRSQSHSYINSHTHTNTHSTPPKAVPHEPSRHVKISPSQSYISKYLSASNLATGPGSEKAILSGKWWLDDEEDKNLC